MSEEHVTKSFRSRHTVALALIIAVTLIRVAVTHRVFSAVVDEPVHIAAGYDWIVLHSAALDPVHPPLTRIFCALGLAGIRPPERTDLVGRGNALLYDGDRYEKNLARARQGNLIFLALTLIAVYLWSASPVCGLIAAAIVATIPSILGHAGLATTDISMAAMVPLALIALERWVAEPGVGRACVAGLAIGAGAVSKFSFLVFFPAAAGVLIAFHFRGLGWRFVKHALIAIGCAFILIWAFYFFDFRTVAAAHPNTVFFLRGTRLGWFFEHVPLPAPLFIAGLHVLSVHNDVGQLSFLLGRYSQRGWWYYFPVVFFFKTPLPFLVLLIWGAIAVVRQRASRVLQYLLMAIAMMLAAMTSNIDIGIRHIIAIYPPLAVVAAYAVRCSWEKLPQRAAAIALLGWMFFGVAIAHPDYMACFNEAAGNHPERIASDSNLDWGQDLLRLGREARKRHIEHAFVNCVGNADLGRAGLPVHDGLPPFAPVNGWVAVSETALVLDDNARKGAYRWLDAYPYERVGRSIRLYDIVRLR